MDSRFSINNISRENYLGVRHISSEMGVSISTLCNDILSEYLSLYRYDNPECSIDQSFIMDKIVQINDVKMYDLHQSAHLLGCHYNTVRNYIKSGKINYKIIGKTFYIPEKEINKILNNE